MKNTDQSRPPFKISGVATIKHLNVRKEGPEDEKVLAVDAAPECTCAAKDMTFGRCCKVTPNA